MTSVSKNKNSHIDDDHNSTNVHQIIGNLSLIAAEN